MIKKTKTLYTIAKKGRDKIRVIKDVIVEYDDEISTAGIDRQIKTIENGYGGGCVWNDTYLSMNMASENNIKDNENYGFEGNLKIMMGINSEVEIILDKPGKMSTSSIMHVFRELEFDALIPINESEAEAEPDYDGFIEAEYAEILELMECRRLAKRLMCRYSSESEMFKKAKEYVIELKKEINRRFAMYDRKCGIDNEQ